MNGFSGINLLDIPSLLPEFDLKNIDKNINFLGMVFNWEMGKEEEKIFSKAKGRGFSCFRIENLNSSEVCANLAYNLNQIGEFVFIWTNDSLLFQVIGPRTNIYFYKEKKLHNIETIEKKFKIEPWKIPDLFSFLGFKEKDIKPVIGIERDKVLKWIKYFSSTEELLNRLDLLEIIEDKKTFHYQNLIEKQKEKILQNLKKLKLEPSFLIPVKKENFVIKKRSKIL